MIKIQVIGFVGNDSVVREVNGKMVINFSVAHTQKYKDSSGQERQDTIWVDCSYWTDKTGIAPYLKKGVQIYVEGVPGSSSYSNQSGKVSSKLLCKVSNVQLLGQSKSEPSTSAPQAHSVSTSSTSTGNSYQPPAPTESDNLDDLPF